jgi:hypothetical protein
MIKSEFLHLESKSDRIEFQILNMSQYFGHNFQLKYLIKVITSAIGKLIQNYTNHDEIGFS